MLQWGSQIPHHKTLRIKITRVNIAYQWVLPDCQVFAYLASLDKFQRTRCASAFFFSVSVTKFGKKENGCFGLQRCRCCRVEGGSPLVLALLAGGGHPGRHTASRRECAGLWHVLSLPWPGLPHGDSAMETLFIISKYFTSVNTRVQVMVLRFFLITIPSYH